MKSIGIVRKIDELGRIVIPKEIRKNLKIKENDDLEIFIEEEKIILQKHYKLENAKARVINVIKIFEKYINFNIILTDREKIIYPLYDELPELLTKKYISIIEERKKIDSDELFKIEISETYTIESFFEVNPIIINTDLLGSIIIEKSNKLT